jgi:hypothetical protein
MTSNEITRTPLAARILSAVVTLCVTLSTLTWTPASYANSAPAPLQAPPAPEVYNPQWMSRLGLGGVNTIAYPKDNWTVLASMQRPARSATDSFAIDLLQGEQWIRNGQFEAGMLGLDSREIGQAMLDFKGEQTVVFGRYVSGTNSLRITAVQMRAFPDGTIKTLKADYTPWTGERLKAYGMYRTQAEINAGVDGYNPFEAFKPRDASGNLDQTNPSFQNLDVAAAQVAMGHAIRHFRADYGVFSAAELGMDRNVSTSGGLLRKKITTTYTGYSKMRWLLVLPVGAMRAMNANTSAICVTTSIAAVGTRTSTCDAPEHVAVAGVEFEELQGGTMPVGKHNLTNETIVKSSFSVLSFAIMIFAVALGGGLLLAANGVIGATAVGAASALGPTTFAAIAAGTYLAASTILGWGGPITQAQAGAFGATGNGVLVASAPSNQHEAVLRQTARQVLILGGLDQSQMPQLKAVYSGQACSDVMTQAQCIAAGGSGSVMGAGLVPRVDTHQGAAPTSRSLKDRVGQCQASGLVGAAYRRCIAPVPNNPSVIGQ